MEKNMVRGCGNLTDRMNQWLKKWNLTPKILIGFLLMAVLLGSTQFDWVNSITVDKTIEITVTGKNENGWSEVYILDYSTSGALFDDFCKAVADNEQWGFYTAEQMNATCDMLVWTGENLGQKTVIKTNTSSLLNLHTGPTSGTISVRVDDGQPIEYNLYSPTWGDTSILFGRNVEGYGITVIRLAIYAGIYLVIFVLFCGTYVFVQWLRKINWVQILNRPSDWMLCAAITMVYLVYSIVSYRSGLEHYLEFGDQCYYWLDATLYSDAFEIAQYGAAFRGYLCQYIPLVMQQVGNLIGRNPLYFWFAYHAAVGGLMVGYALPAISEFFTGKKTTYGQTLLLTAVYSVFNMYQLPWVGMDLSGVSCFLLGIALALKFLQLGGYRYAVLSGVAFAAASLFRSAYVYGIYGLLLVGGVCYFFQRRRNRKQPGINPAGVISVKKLTLGVVLAVAALMVVCIPQIYSNLQQGVYSPFPYPGPFLDYDNLTTYSASISLQGLFLGQPWQISDAHTDSMALNANIANGTWDMPTVFYVFSNNIHDALVYIVKKLFIGFDNKFPPAYTKDKFLFTSWCAFCSYFNYCIMGTALYVLLYLHKELPKGEKILMATLFATTILPLTLLHVEWRYFIVGYMLAYYVVAFRFVPAVCKMDRGNAVKEMERYFLFMPCFILLSQWASASFYA